MFLYQVRSAKFIFNREKVNLLWPHHRRYVLMAYYLWLQRRIWHYRKRTLICIAHVVIWRNTIRSFWRHLKAFEWRCYTRIFSISKQPLYLQSPELQKCCGNVRRSTTFKKKKKAERGSDCSGEINIYWI